MPLPRLALSAVLMTLAACSLPAQQLPRPAGEWSILTPDGKTIQLSSYRGKVVVLAFILTTCPHCQKSVGILSRLQPEYAPRGVQFLASAAEGGAKAAVPGFVQNFHVPFPVGYNEDPQKLLDFWQIPPSRMPTMPVVLLIDRQGNIRFEHEGHDEKFFGDQQEQNFRAELDELLKAPAKKAAARKKN
jgi:peroxiredoxin